MSHLIQPHNKVQISSVSLLIEWSLKCALLFIIILTIVPFSPKMPAPGLDASWSLALNQAVAQGLSFGKEIIFSFGPYSSIYTKAYHPSTDLMMIGGSLYLACSYWLCVVLLMRQTKWRWIMAFATLIFGMIYAKDSLFFSYPLLAGLNCFKILNANNKSFIAGKRFHFLLALLFAPFGLLVLIKVSLMILCLIVAILCFLFFLYNKNLNSALICLLSPMISMSVFWLGAGQAVFNLPYYFINSISLASGFSEAMALDGNNNDIFLYLIASGLILFSIAWQKGISKSSKIFLLCIFFVFLFVSFKTGFTRHFGHSFITGTSILIAALILPFLFKSKITVPVILLSLYTSIYIDGQHTKISLLNNFASTFSPAWYGLKNRLQDPNWVKQNYEVTLKFLHAQSSFPRLSGSADDYSYDQSYLIASGMNWSPRPIFQSYSVFTPKMAEKNKKYLLGDNRPDHLIFKIEPIDERIPSLEDGISWPVLLSHYQPDQLINDFLLLRKKISNQQAHLLSIKKEQHFIGEMVNVPAINQPIFAEIELKPTVWGLLAIWFFKPQQLHVTFELKNGTKKQFRLIANMAKSGFLLSPLIEETAEFGLLYSENTLLNKQVKSFVISTSPGSIKQWHDEYLIHFKRIKL